MKPAPEQPTINRCNCFASRRTARQTSRFYDAILQPSGLRITQFLTLATLNEMGSSAINLLAERLDIERTAMGKMIGFLEKDGLVSVRPSSHDARSRLAELTGQGRAAFNVAHPLWLRAQRLFEEANGRAAVEALHRPVILPPSGPATAS